jgi:predicted enzyme related to lactoylglutathione lyase
MNRPTHFEIPAKDAAKMEAFYSAVFQWNITKWPGPQEYWLISTGEGPGINGGFMPRQEPNPGTVITMTVENLEATMQSVTEHGGVIVLPKMPIQGVGYLAYAKDPEGNIFGFMQNDTSAA